MSLKFISNVLVGWLLSCNRMFARKQIKFNFDPLTVVML